MNRTYPPLVLNLVHASSGIEHFIQQLDEAISLKKTWMHDEKNDQCEPEELCDFILLGCDELEAIRRFVILNEDWLVSNLPRNGSINLFYIMGVANGVDEEDS